MAVPNLILFFFQEGISSYPEAVTWVPGSPRLRGPLIYAQDMYVRGSIFLIKNQVRRHGVVIQDSGAEES